MTLKVAIGPSSFSADDSRPLQMLKDAGIEVIANPFGRRLTESEIIEHLQHADGLLAGLEPLNSKVLSAAPRLRALTRVGIGMTNVDVHAAERLGISVANTPEGPTEAVAELTLTVLLDFLRNPKLYDADVKKGVWNKRVLRGLRGTKVLMIGFGRIGRRVAELMLAFGAELFVYDPYLNVADVIEMNVRFVGLEEGLKQVEVISLHASGDQAILDEYAFGLMQDGVLILNPSRGELIDEQALLSALDHGKVSRIWMDAFWKEPYTGKLINYEQALLTPHIATYTRQCRLDMEMKAVELLLKQLGV